LVVAEKYHEKGIGHIFNTANIKRDIYDVWENILLQYTCIRNHYKSLMTKMQKIVNFKGMVLG
jgi:hypothetical protein